MKVSVDASHDSASHDNVRSAQPAAVDTASPPNATRSAQPAPTPTAEPIAIRQAHVAVAASVPSPLDVIRTTRLAADATSPPNASAAAAQTKPKAKRAEAVAAAAESKPKSKRAETAAAAAESKPKSKRAETAPAAAKTKHAEDRSQSSETEEGSLSDGAFSSETSDVQLVNNHMIVHTA